MEFYGEFNGMCFLLCIVVQCTCTHHIHIFRYDVMWCDVIMLKFNFISFFLFFCLYFFSSFIRIKRMNERYALSSNFFFRSFSVRLLARCCRFWWWCQICIVIEPLYLARSFALFLSRSRRLAMVLRQFRGGNLKMCRFDPIMRQSIDLVLFNGLRAKVNEWERARVCEKDNANEIDDISFVVRVEPIEPANMVAYFDSPFFITHFQFSSFVFSVHVYAYAFSWAHFICLSHFSLPMRTLLWINIQTAYGFT